MKLCVVLILSIVLPSLIGLPTCSSERASSMTKNDARPCLDVKPLLHRLGSPNKNTREDAKKEILGLTEQSASSRQCIISAMIGLANKVTTEQPNGFMLAVKSPRSYEQWLELTEILGAMKAAEALDLLIDNLDFNDGKTNLGIRHYPAAIAMARLGDQAIPGLTKILKRGSLSKKYLAAYTLCSIGGVKAKQALEKAASDEKDTDIVSYFRNGLQYWRCFQP